MIYYLKHNIHKLNWTIIGNVLGMVLIAQACLMVLPVMVDLIYQEGLFDSYLIVIGICLVLGYGLTRKKARTNSYFAKDGMLAVGIAWIVVSFFGGLPFYLSGEIPSFVDCFFEAVSGLVVWVSWFSFWPYFQSQMIVICILCVRKRRVLPLVN